MGIHQLSTLIILDYQYQSIIDGNQSINNRLLSMCNINRLPISDLFSETFQLSISSSTNKVTHFDIISFYLSKN